MADIPGQTVRHIEPPYALDRLTLYAPCPPSASRARNGSFTRAFIDPSTGALERTQDNSLSKLTHDTQRSTRAIAHQRRVWDKRWANVELQNAAAARLGSARAVHACSPMRALTGSSAHLRRIPFASQRARPKASPAHARAARHIQRSWRAFAAGRRARRAAAEVAQGSSAFKGSRRPQQLTASMCNAAGAQLARQTCMRAATAIQTCARGWAVRRLRRAGDACDAHDATGWRARVVAALKIQAHFRAIRSVIVSERALLCSHELYFARMRARLEHECAATIQRFARGMLCRGADGPHEHEMRERSATRIQASQRRKSACAQARKLASARELREARQPAREAKPFERHTVSRTRTIKQPRTLGGEAAPSPGRLDRPFDSQPHAAPVEPDSLNGVARCESASPSRAVRGAPVSSDLACATSGRAASEAQPSSPRAHATPKAGSAASTLEEALARMRLAQLSAAATATLMPPPPPPPPPARPPVEAKSARTPRACKEARRKPAHAPQAVHAPQPTLPSCRAATPPPLSPSSVTSALSRPPTALPAAGRRPVSRSRAFQRKRPAAVLTSAADAAATAPSSPPVSTALLPAAPTAGERPARRRPASSGAGSGRRTPRAPALAAVEADAAAPRTAALAAGTLSAAYTARSGQVHSGRAASRPGSFSRRTHPRQVAAAETAIPPHAVPTPTPPSAPAVSGSRQLTTAARPAVFSQWASARQGTHRTTKTTTVEVMSFEDLMAALPAPRADALSMFPLPPQPHRAPPAITMAIEMQGAW